MYQSQIASGKKYDVAIRGRNIANATFDSEREIDILQQGSYALDLNPLVLVKELSVGAYLNRLSDNLKSEINTNLQAFEN